MTLLNISINWIIFVKSNTEKTFVESIIIDSCHIPPHLCSKSHAITESNNLQNLRLDYTGS